MARAPVSKTGGWGFEVPPLLPVSSITCSAGTLNKSGAWTQVGPNHPRMPAEFGGSSLGRSAFNE